MPDITPTGPTPEIRLTCAQVTEAIVDYLTEAMDAAMRLAFATHLSQCQDCRAFLRTYQETIRSTRTVRYETIPEDMLSRVEQFLRGQITPPRSS
jgi:predicted anti-sigma-YlaC factor YlaD